MNQGTRGGITDADVFKAADALFSQGINPSQGKIRAFLGRGSFSTIAPALKRWKARANQRDCVQTVTLPTTLNASGKAFFGQDAWDAFCTQALKTGSTPEADDAPSYRLLEDNEVIMKDDEVLGDDANSWRKVSPLFWRMAYNKRQFLPVRRVIQ